MGTCAGSGSDTLDKMTFPALLLDEASQATEPSSLVAISRGARTIAMIGDHEQLPPTVICPEAKELGLDRSLFDRLVSRGLEPALLELQYRSHPALTAFPSVATYGGRIRSGVPKASRPVPAGFDWPLKGVPIVFVPVDDGREQRVGSSFCNQAEVTAVERLLQQLLRPGDLRMEDVGVITPYQEQVKLFKRTLPPAVEVSTVDGFQGREKEFIFISTVRASDGGSIGFIKDRRRTNVTLTRARRGLAVCGHPGTLARDVDGLWAQWLAWAIAHGLAWGCTQGKREDAAAALQQMDMDNVYWCSMPGK